MLIPMSFDQIAIALFGALAVWLSQARAARWRRWACVFGLLGQPFWFWASWRTGQWGVFAVSGLYALAWLRGVWVHWLAPRAALEVSPAVGTIQLAPGPRR
ncbi:Nicotinamide riboside transporter PnuC [Paracidovorax anthurii]